MSKLKTVWDAVNELRGDVESCVYFDLEVPFIGMIYVGTIKNTMNNNALQVTDEAIENDSWSLACAITEFNALVEDMKLGLDVNPVNYGYYLDYVDADKTPLEKETKPDYTSLEFWKDAPEDMVTLGAIGKAGTLVFYNDDNYKYICSGSIFPFKKENDCTFDYGEVAFIACHPQSTPTETPEEKEPLKPISKPLVYTQEMSDNGVMPSVGMKCIAESKGIGGGSDLVTVSQINDKGQFACIDDNGDYLIHYPNEDKSDSFKPIDQRTDTEKAIDSLNKFNLCMCKDWQEDVIGFIKSGEFYGVKWVGE